MILALLSFKKSALLSAAFIAIAIISALGMEIYVGYMRTKVNPERITIKSCKRCDAEVLSYIVTYLIPFMADFSKSDVELLALLVFFFVIGYLYVNSNMIHINPLLSFRGFHLLEVETTDGIERSLLAKIIPRAGVSVAVVAIGDDVYLESAK